MAIIPQVSASKPTPKYKRAALIGFGTDHEEALKRYLNEKDDLEAGIVPNRAVEERDCRLVDLVNAFLTHRKQQVEAGEKSQSGFIVYKRWGETGECRH